MQALLVKCKSSILEAWRRAQQAVPLRRAFLRRMGIVRKAATGVEVEGGEERDQDSRSNGKSARWRRFGGGRSRAMPGFRSPLLIAYDIGLIVGSMLS